MRSSSTLIQQIKAWNEDIRLHGSKNDTVLSFFTFQMEDFVASAAVSVESGDSAAADKDIKHPYFTSSTAPAVKPASPVLSSQKAILDSPPALEDSPGNGVQSGEPNTPRKGVRLSAVFSQLVHELKGFKRK